MGGIRVDMMHMKFNQVKGVKSSSEASRCLVQVVYYSWMQERCESNNKIVARITDLQGFFKFSLHIKLARRLLL